jgi:osmotically-inducible protein OsmY
LVSALHREHWIAGNFVGISVENGVVHFTGEVDSMHGVLALRQIAAATPGTKAIIDDLWVPCE